MHNLKQELSHSLALTITNLCKIATVFLKILYYKYIYIYIYNHYYKSEVVVKEAALVNQCYK